MATGLSLAARGRAGLGAGPRRAAWPAGVLAAVAFVVLLVLAGCAGPPGAPRPAGPTWGTGAGATGEARRGLTDGPEPVGPPRPGPVSPANTTLGFGLDAGSLAVQQAQGVHAGYATIWVGVWDLEKGWLVPDAQLATLRAAGVTPAIQLFYWGDDLAPACFGPAGCNGKTVEGWDRLIAQLGEHLQARMNGSAVLVVLETEFNKGSVARYEPLDAPLGDNARAVRAASPAARVVRGFGGWNPDAWGTWDRAAAASDAVGL